MLCSDSAKASPSEVARATELAAPRQTNAIGEDRDLLGRIRHESLLVDEMAMLGARWAPDRLE